MLDERVLCLFSGGIDSTVLLWTAMREYRYVTALSINYDGRPSQEVEACEKIIDLAGNSTGNNNLRLTEVAVSGISKPSGSSGFIPKRNLIFYSIAASICEQREIKIILGGQIRTDQVEFSDAGREYILCVKSILNHDHGPEIDILLPLIDMDKSQVVSKGLNIGAPLEFTWSCHSDGVRQCGKCSACFERTKYLKPCIRKTIA